MAVAAITNALGLIATLRNGLPIPLEMAGNLMMMNSMMRVYFQPPAWLLQGLVGGVIVVEAVIALLFLRNRSTQAFALALMLFGAFIIIDDVFVAYQIEAAHRVIFILFCAGYLVVRNAGT